MTKSEAAKLNGKKGGRPRKHKGDAPKSTPVQETHATQETHETHEAPVTAAPPLENPFGLTPRELLFVEAYCGVANFNASDAYRAAGYEGKPASVSANAARLIGSDRVSKAVSAKLSARVQQLRIMDGDEALTRISTFARADIRKLFPPESRIAQLPDEVAACVKSITPNKFGLRIELIDPLRANELMAKVAGRLKETIKVEHTLEQIMAMANASQTGTAA